jgi:ribosomal protein S6E (S10)
MAFKINISDKGKAWKVQLESEVLVGKSLGDKIDGKDIKAELEGYEFEITGGSDISGFPMAKEIVGIGLKRRLLSKGWGMRDSGEGMLRRKTQRGKTISSAVSLINMKVIKSGSKALQEIFPEQNQPKAKKEAAPAPVAA